VSDLKEDVNKQKMAQRAYKQTDEWGEIPRWQLEGGSRKCAS
jgi:hypothetical protein